METIMAFECKCGVLLFNPKMEECLACKVRRLEEENEALRKEIERLEANNSVDSKGRRAG
jgi:predicted Ser/Thr protein kinase